MGFAGAGPADEHGIALLGDEATAGEVIDERLVDWRALEVEVIEVLGERQLGYGELVFDRARCQPSSRTPATSLRLSEPKETKRAVLVPCYVTKSLTTFVYFSLISEVPLCCQSGLTS
jgi:hypothetical protein